MLVHNYPIQCRCGVVCGIQVVVAAICGVEHVQHAVSDDGIHAVLYLHKYKRFIVPPGW